MSDQILDNVMAGTAWHETAVEMRAWGWELQEQVEDGGERLIREVLIGDITVKQLKGAIKWANALEHDAHEAGIKIDTTGGDGVEALARRIAHHAGIYAFKRVKVEWRRHQLAAAVFAHQQRSSVE